MKNLFRCSMIRDDFRQWLAGGHGPMTVRADGRPSSMLLKLEKDPSVRYLYQTATGKDGGISWNNSLAFCGAYEADSRALYLTEDAMASLAGGRSPLAAGTGDSVAEEIRGGIGREIERIIADDRNSLGIREIAGAMALRDLDYYRKHGAREDAIRKFFEDDAPDGRFRSGYVLEDMAEDDFLAYIKDPADFVETEAGQHVKANQEKFLLQFLKNDALLAEYQALMRDAGDPIHRMKAITDAVKASGAKTVAVTVRKDGRELAFKAEAGSLIGHRNQYSASFIQASDRRKFKELFGRHADYTAEDVIRIAYGRKAIYDAAAIRTAPADAAGTETAI